MRTFQKYAATALMAGLLPLCATIACAEKDTDYDRDGDNESAKQLNDPLPPTAMPKNTAVGAVPTPRGTPEGMGNETDFSKTPGDDDPSDGVDEAGRNPIPGQPRLAPGVNTEGSHGK